MVSSDAARNRELWTRTNAEYTDDQGRRAWAADEITWGIWGLPEAEVGALAGIELAGRDVVELGCGTAYLSAWLARRGARPVGVDVTPAQLETARRLQVEHGLEFPLVEADAAETELDDEEPALERLVHPQFGMYRFEWPGGGVEYHLPHGEWIRLLRDNGFEVEALHELQAPPDAETHEYYGYVTADWGRKWPAEEIWRARKSGA